MNPDVILPETDSKIYLNKLERKFQTEIRYLKYTDYAVSFRRGNFITDGTSEQSKLRKGTQICMSQLLFDDEDYYFQINEALEDDKQFVLIIYDIVDNKKRIKFSKMLEGYGKRVQKSAFEAMLSSKSYNKLMEEIPKYVSVKLQKTA